MTTYARSYELRVHDRGATDPTDATVDFVLSDEITSVPTIPGALVRPLDGRTETQAWTLRVHDKDGVITSHIAGSDGRAHLLGRIVEWRENGVAVYTGRLVGITSADPVAYELRIADERWVERSAVAFRPTPSPSNTTLQTTLIAPRGLRYRYGLFAATPIPRLRVSVVQGDYVLFQGFPASQSVIDLLRSDLRPDRDFTGGQGNFSTLRANLNGTDYEIAWLSNEFGYDRYIKVIDEGGEPLIAGVYIYAPGHSFVQGQDVAFFLHMPNHEPHEAMPLHIGVADASHKYGTAEGGIHPFKLLEILYQDAGVRYDATAMAALQADTRYPRVRYRVTEATRLSEWVEDNIYKPFGVVPLINSKGEVAPTPLWLAQDLDPSTLPILTAADVKEPYPTWDHSDTDLITRVRFTVPVETLHSGFGDVPTDRIDVTDMVFEVAHDRDGEYGERVHRITMPRLHTAGSERPLGEVVAREIFDWVGDGPIYGTTHVMEHVSVDAGQLIVLDQDTIMQPNPATGARTGDRIVRVLQKRRLPVGYAIDWMDAGPSAQPLAAPTVSVAQNPNDPYHSVVATVSGLPSGVGYTLQVDRGDGVWVGAGTRTGDGTTVVHACPSGTTIKVRAAATRAGRIRSPWSTEASVTTQALSPPTDVVAIPQGRTITATCTVGESGYPVMPVIDGVDALPEPLPAGSSRWTFSELDASTSYTVGFRHVDVYGGASSVATASATTGATTQLVAPRQLTILQGTGDPLEPNGTWRHSLGDRSLGLEIGFVPVERHAPHTVEVSTSQAFTSVLYRIVAEPGRDTVRIPMAYRADLLHVRVRAEREGWTASGWSETVSAYATVLQPWTPRHDRFPGGWAFLTVDAGGIVALDLGSDDADTDRAYYAVSTSGYPEVDGSSDFVDRAMLPATVDPGVSLSAGETAFATVRFWNATSGFGQSVRARVVAPPDPDIPVGALPPTALIEYVSEGATTVQLRYTGQLGTGATGSLQYRRRFVLGSVPGPWGPGTGAGWATLPSGGVTEDVNIPPKSATVVELEVRDEAGRVGRDTYDIAPRLPVIGGDGRLNPDEQPYDDPLAPPLRDVVDGSGRARAGLTEGGRVKLGVEPTADIAGAPAQDVTADAQTGRRVFEAGLQGARNLLANPGFEEGEDFWWRTPTSGGSWSVPDNPANAHSGRRYAAVNCLGGQQQTLVYAAPRVGADEGRYIEVSEGDVVRWGAWVRRVTGDGLCRVRLALYDADRVAISFPSSTDVTVNAWTLSEGQVTIPAGVQYIRLALQVFEPTTDTLARFDDVYLSIASDLDRHIVDGATYRRTTRDEADGGGRAYTTIEPGGGVLTQGVTINDGVSPKVPVTGARQYFLTAAEAEPTGNPGDPGYVPAITFDPPYQDVPLVLVQGPMASHSDLSGTVYRREYAEGVTAAGIHRVVAQLVSLSGVSTETDLFPSGTISGEGNSQEVTLLQLADDNKYLVTYGIFLTASAPGGGFNRASLNVVVAVDTQGMSPVSTWIERATRAYTVSAGSGTPSQTINTTDTVEVVAPSVAKIRVRIKTVAEIVVGDGSTSHEVDPERVEYQTFGEVVEPMAQDGQRIRVIVMGAT